MVSNTINLFQNPIGDVPSTSLGVNIADARLLHIKYMYLCI